MNTQSLRAEQAATGAILSLVLRNHIWVFLALTLVAFSLSSEYFLTMNNIGNILTQGAFIGFLAIGMTMVMIDGEIDLSVGATLALAGLPSDCRIRSASGRPFWWRWHRVLRLAF